MNKYEYVFWDGSSKFIYADYYDFDKGDHVFYVAGKEVLRLPPQDVIRVECEDCEVSA